MDVKFIGKRVQVEHVVMTVRVPKKVRDRIQPRIDAKMCLIEGCDNKASARGLCATCRAASKTAVNSGKVTEEDLIKQGMILPEQSKGRPAKNKFAEQLESVTD